MLRLDLSGEADADLNAILEYGTRTWGEAASDAYYDGLCAAFDFLCAWPEAGQIDEETGLGLRRWRYAQHRIFYRIGAGRLTVVRVFHISADAVRWLKD